MKDKEKQIEFKVIDNKTGKEADIGKIALKEDWAKSLMYCDMQGFAITEDNHLILLDECGKYEFCPSDRFEIIPEDSVVLSMEEHQALKKQIEYWEYETKVAREEIDNAVKETAEKIKELEEENKNLKWQVKYWKNETEIALKRERNLLNKTEVNND